MIAVINRTYREIYYVSSQSQLQELLAETKGDLDIVRPNLGETSDRFVERVEAMKERGRTSEPPPSPGKRGRGKKMRNSVGFC